MCQGPRQVQIDFANWTTGITGSPLRGDGVERIYPPADERTGRKVGNSALVFQLSLILHESGEYLVPIPFTLGLWIISLIRVDL